MVASKPRPTEPKVTSRTWFLFDIAHGSGEAKGAAPIKTTTHSCGKVNWTFSNTITKDE